MRSSLSRWGTLALAGFVVLGARSAPAQTFRPPGVIGVPPNVAANQALARQLSFQQINPNFRLANGQTIQQWAYNTSVYGRALSNVPPYALGYNPYPQVVNTGPVVNPYTYNPYAYNPYYNPYLSTGAYSPYSGGTAALTTNPAYGSTLTTSDAGSLYAPEPNPYNAWYNPNPYGGYLSGAADLVTSYGNYAISVQRARLLSQEVYRSSIDSRRRIWEEARYERGSLLNSEQVRQADIRSALDRARHDPPLPEVWSGSSLNALFDDIAAQQGKGLKGPTIPIDEKVLQHINLTPGKNGNAGLLKTEMQWPASLRGPEFKEAREKLDGWIKQAVKEAEFNKTVPANLLNDISAEVRKLNEAVQRSVGEMTPAQYIESKRFLNRLDDAVSALHDPNVWKYFNKEWAAQGKTVGELVENMARKQGLRFAPAAPGEEWAYNALYQALAAYDAGIQVAAKPPSSPSSTPTQP